MRKASAQDVISLLPIVADRDWQVLEGGAIRTKTPSYDGSCHCPLSALAEEISGEPVDGCNTGFFDSSDTVAAKGRIVAAVDLWADWSPRHRAAIKRALGRIV